MAEIEHKDLALVVFQDKKIRRIWHNDEWWFSVVDIVAVLTDSPTPRQYWSKIKDREFTALQLSPIWVQLKLVAEDGKLRETDCANTKNMFRIIQSITSPKAEPFKLWLAQVGYERVQEIENPELGKMIRLWKENETRFRAHYHRHSNAESAFSMIKRKFGDCLRGKLDTTKENEIMCKVICHNLTVLANCIILFGISPDFT